MNAGPSIAGFTSDLIGYSMIAHAVGFHGTATAMSRVLISGSHNVYVGEIPEEYTETIPFGKLLAAMRLSESGGLVVGLRSPEGREFINPPKSLEVRPKSHLLYLAKKPLLKPPQ